MDVVPAGSGWNTDPYKPEIIDSKVYAVHQDDKAHSSMLPWLSDYQGSGIASVRLWNGTDSSQAGAIWDHYFNTSDFLIQTLASLQMLSSITTGKETLLSTFTSGRNRLLSS